MTDTDFLKAFEDTALPRTEWTHTAHVRMAYLYLRDNLNTEAVLPTICNGIRRYNASQGNPHGYHDTITVALVRLIADRLQAEPSENFVAFTLTNPDLIHDAFSVLLRHYTRERLVSPEARTGFVEPDLLVLPGASMPDL